MPELACASFMDNSLDGTEDRQFQVENLAMPAFGGLKSVACCS